MRRVARSQYSRGTKHTDAHLLAVNVLDPQVAADAIADELRLVIAFQRITEDEIVSHDSVQSVAIAVCHRGDPLFIHVPQVLFNLESVRVCAHLPLLLRQSRGRVKCIDSPYPFCVGVG